MSGLQNDSELFNDLCFLQSVVLWDSALFNVFCFLQLVVLCVVRKVMDYVFTKSELYWLDHLLPDEHRRKKEDDALEDGLKDIEAEKMAAKVRNGFHCRSTVNARLIHSPSLVLVRLTVGMRDDL